MELKQDEKHFSSVQYAMKICEDLLGIPQKGNIEYIAEAIDGLAAKNFRGRDDAKALAFLQLHRRVRVAVQQGARITAYWFKDGQYLYVEDPQEQTSSKPQRTVGCSKCESGWIVREIPCSLYKSGKQRRAFPCECRTH